MNIESEIDKILVQFWLHNITMLEARERLIDLIEAPKEMECEECGKYSKKGDVIFFCEDCQPEY